MSTRAVTPDAPAVSERNSNFLPSDENYRLTGAMPDASSERDVRDTRDENRQEDATGQRNKSAVTEEAPAASETEEQDSSTAAASEAANAQEKAKGPAQTKTPNSSENRWQKREREIRELREENARLKASQTSAPPRSETQQEPRPATEAKAANAEPQIEDVDAGGKPKYVTLKDFMAAHAKWNREEAIREVTASSTKAQQAREQQQLEETIRKTVTERAEAARKVYPDYDEAFATVASVKDQFGHDALFFPERGHIDTFLYRSERGSEVLYHIAKNFGDPQIRAIFARDQSGMHYTMNAVDQLRALAQIEYSLPAKGKTSSASQSSSVKTITQAHRPPHQVSGNGTVGKDAVEQALEENDAGAYMRAENAKAIARLAKKG